MKLPTLQEVAASRTGRIAKPESRRRVKGRKARAETTVKRSIREQCSDRDWYCRASQLAWRDDAGRQLTVWAGERDACDGRAEWAHLHSHRRSKTRGQAATVRHTTAGSLMLCTRHHDQYDGRATPRLIITALSRKGADGPLRFTRAERRQIREAVQVIRQIAEQG